MWINAQMLTPSFVDDGKSGGARRALKEDSTTYKKIQNV